MGTMQELFEQKLFNSFEDMRKQSTEQNRI